MRYYEGQHTFDYSWDKVARAYWCRYPNPWSKHVLSEDVLDRHIDGEGRLITKRLLSKTNKAPKWTEKFISARCVYIVEESIVDPVGKTFVTFTRNVGLQSFMTIEEKVKYTAVNDRGDWTVSERQAWINSNMFGISRAVQALGFERFKSNVAKASKGYQFVLDAMFNPLAASKYDASTFAHVHPLLMERFKEHAKNIKDLSDKAKQKAVPIMAAALPTERQ
ncbi:PRELI domain-containing protein 1, mitochondrial [Halotydeus destructor]|nr:PRELI domain-containing protein 1, mitochondrial [Halotydeus destructor]